MTMGREVEVLGQGMRPTPSSPIPSVSSMRGFELLRLTMPELEEAVKTTDNRRALLDVQSAIHKLLIPAGRPQIAAHIARLANHYHATPRGDAAAQCYAEDWLDDLAHLPDDIIEAACVKWRRDDNKFMCSPGEFLKYANEIMRYRKFYADRAARVLRVGQGLANA